VSPSQVWQTSPALDGKIYGEPLVYGSTVYVATENDTVYALNASSGTIEWQNHVATPVPSGQLPCGDISPVVGITSTPVIDPASGRIFVVGDTWNGTAARHELFGLNLSDGSPAPGSGTVIDPPGSDPLAQLQRASLALDAGKVIVGEGGNDGDCSTYHGWLIAVPEGGGALQTYEVDSQPGDDEGAVWAAGNAPPIDSAGDIWFSTGNGNSGSTFDYSESVIKLDSNLNQLDYWAPSDWQSLDSGDADLGSAMPILLPGGLVFQIGKGGIGYLLSAASLGGLGGTPVYEASVCTGSWGGGIYYSGVIYVTCSDGMHALALDTSAQTFSPLASWSVNGNAVGPPIEAGGKIWSAGYNNGTLYGLDPATGATSYSKGLTSFVHFATPSAGGGLLFVANSTRVTAFQIAGTPSPSGTSVAVSSSANPAGLGQPVTLTATVSPTPDAGTVAFSDGGSTISGCGAVPVGPSAPQATCTTTFGATGQHAIVATYSGDAYYASSSGSLTQSVTTSGSSGPGGGSGNVVPVITHLRARAVKRKLRLTFTLSERAKLTIVLSRNVPGRRVNRRCRAGARHGRRCTILVRKATFRPTGRKGRNSLRPRMRALAAGSYTVTITAIDAAGGRSKRYTVTFMVRGS
jgi:outer membrane protein assembly factor BamB